MAKILILGGTRFVGPHVVRELLTRGHDVVLYSRGNFQISHNNLHVHCIKGDRDIDGLRVISHHFDVVIDMCAYWGDQTARALSELRFDFFVHLSTVAVYEKTNVFPLQETSPIGLWPMWGKYNIGKVECEKVLEQSGVPYVSLRPVYILGSHNYKNREQFIYSRLKDGLPITLPPHNATRIQFVFADEVARCLAILAEQKIEGIFNCASDDVITLRELVEIMADISNTSPVIVNTPSFQDYTKEKNYPKFPFQDEQLFASNKKIKEILAVSFVSLREGLQRDYDAYYYKSRC